MPNFNFLTGLVSEIWRLGGVPKFNVGILSPAAPRALKRLRVFQVLGKIKQFAKCQHRSSIVQLCEYVFAVGFLCGWPYCCFLSTRLC